MEYLKAFLAGGTLCLIGQLLIDKTKLTPARILVSYVVIGVFLGAVGLYQPFAEFAGAGATVPLTGFGWNLARGVREAVEETGFLGIFTGGLGACAGGIAAAVFFALLASLFFRAKDKSAESGQTRVAAKPQVQTMEDSVMNNQNQNKGQNQEKSSNQNQTGNQNKNCR